ncbi:MAG: RNA polymerase sigma factor [Rhodobacteraceae bacterium]|nr:MAG: RNA polymerase sigma factor [Paracoccaceae bacterium]
MDPDAGLLAAYAAGDPLAARTLTARLGPRVLALARRMLADEAEAEDVTQEAMMRLWKIAPDWRTGEAKVSTWLHRVAANLCLDRLRRRPTLPLDAAPEAPDPTPGAFETLAEADRAAALSAALDALPDRQRAAIALRHFEGLANPAIAEALGVSVEAVESLLARGRRALAVALAPHRAET